MVFPFPWFLLADSYQYQLQSMWQKCWNTNQSLVHNLRFRERGPLKSWRPETMAEAILSVLKEGLSLSQAARKYDIPYPTFVLYANRVHNMLGPSADGGSGKSLLNLKLFFSSILFLHFKGLPIYNRFTSHSQYINITKIITFLSTETMAVKHKTFI